MVKYTKPKYKIGDIITFKLKREQHYLLLQGKITYASFVFNEWGYQIEHYYFMGHKKKAYYDNITEKDIMDKLN